MSTALIGLDWGSSSLRAWRFSASGAALDQRASDAGASRIAAEAAASGRAADFETPLRALIGDWLQAEPQVPLLASGMVGSAHGWVEAPYVTTPVVLDLLAQHLSRARGTDGLVVAIVPGVSHRDESGVPDVMRGEETQIAGVLAADPGLDEALIVLPGTHSKWVRCGGGAIATLQTWMTGELFELLRAHSVLGRLMKPAAADFTADAAAFERGVRAARDGAALAARLFSVRTLGLFGQLAGESAAAYLSGLLIGHELGNALPGSGALTIVLAGDAALCARYRQALACFDREARPAVPNAAAQGLWAIARQARLVAAA